MLQRISVVITTLFLMGVSLAAQQPSAAQEGFVQANELPPGQQIPAAPLLVGSYAFFLVLMMFYLWTIWRRIGKVEHEMQELERRQGGSGR